MSCLLQENKVPITGDKIIIIPNSPEDEVNDLQVQICEHTTTGK